MSEMYGFIFAAVFFLTLCVLKTEQNDADPIINNVTSQDAIEKKETTAEGNGTVTEQVTEDPISKKFTKQDADDKEGSTVDQTEAVTADVTDVSKQEANGDEGFLLLFPLVANPEDEGPTTSVAAAVTRNDMTIKSNEPSERRKQQAPDTVTKENNVKNDATTEVSVINEATKAENKKKEVTEAAVPNKVSTKEDKVLKEVTQQIATTIATKKDVVTPPVVVTNATQKTEPKRIETEQVAPTKGSTIGPSRVPSRPNSPLVNKETLAPPCISKDAGNRRYVLYLNEVRRDITSTTCDIPTYARTTELNLRLCVMNATLSYSITIETENVKYQFSPRIDTCVTCLFSYSDIKVMTFLSIVFAELEGCEQVERRSCTVKRIDW